MKLRRGDICIFDPENKCRQSIHCGTIHAIVISTTFRKAKVFSMETYEVFECPKKLLLSVTSMDLPKVQLVDRSATPTPRFSDKEIELVGLMCKAHNAMSDKDEDGDTWRHIHYLMQADRIGHVINTESSMFERVTAEPSAMNNVSLFMESKTVKEWNEIDKQIEEFMAGVIPVCSRKILETWNSTAENAAIYRMTQVIDDYYSDGTEVTVCSIFDCLREIFDVNDMKEIGDQYSDQVVSAIIHIIRQYSLSDSKELVTELAESADEFNPQTGGILLAAIESYFGNSNPLLDGFDYGSE